MENKTNGAVMADRIRNAVNGIVPVVDIRCWGAENYETGKKAFYVRIPVPSIE